VTANGIRIGYDTLVKQLISCIIVDKGRWEPDALSGSRVLRIIDKKGHIVIWFDNRDVGVPTKAWRAQEIRTSANKAG
jgi:hypothetical protein